MVRPRQTSFRCVDQEQFRNAERFGLPASSREPRPWRPAADRRFPLHGPSRSQMGRDFAAPLRLTPWVKGSQLHPRAIRLFCNRAQQAFQKSCRRQRHAAARSALFRMRTARLIAARRASPSPADRAGANDLAQYIGVEQLHPQCPRRVAWRLEAAFLANLLQRLEERGIVDSNWIRDVPSGWKTSFSSALPADLRVCPETLELATDRR